MSPPYSARIMACLPSHSPVELARFSHPMAGWEYKFWTSDLAPEWEVWVETRCPDKYLVGPRPKLTPKTGATALPKITASENRALEEDGIQPAFKV